MTAKFLKQSVEQLIDRINKVRGFSADVIPYGLPGVTVIDICDRSATRIAKLSVSTAEEYRRAERAADAIIKLAAARKCKILAAGALLNSVTIQITAEQVHVFNLNTEHGQRTFKKFVSSATPPPTSATPSKSTKKE